MKYFERQKEAAFVCWMIISNMCSAELEKSIETPYTRYNDTDMNYQDKRERNLVKTEVPSNRINKYPNDYKGVSKDLGRMSDFPKLDNILEEQYMHEHGEKKKIQSINKATNMRDTRSVIPDFYFYRYLENMKKRELERNRLPNCNLDQLMSYLANLQIITPESIVNLAPKGNLDTLCRKLSTNIADVDKYLQTCQPPQQKDLYMKLINGVRTLNHMLCIDKTFKTEFNKHKDCLSKLNQEYTSCIGPSDWQENPDIKAICKTYADISNCYYEKTITKCGPKAAEIMQILMKGIVDSVLTVFCDSSAETHTLLPNSIASGETNILSTQTQKEQNFQTTESQNGQILQRNELPNYQAKGTKLSGYSEKDSSLTNVAKKRKVFNILHITLWILLI